MLPQFEVATFSSQIFWLIIVFAFLYIIVSKIIAPKAESILTARNRCLAENIAISEDYSGRAKNLRAEKQLRLQELDLETEKLRDEALEVFDRNFALRKEQLERSLTEKEAKVLMEIKEYRDSFGTGKTKAVLDLSAFIIEKITGQPADLKLLKKIHGSK